MKPVLQFLLLLMSLLSMGCAYRYAVMPTINIAGPEMKGSTVNFADYQVVKKNVEGEDLFPIIIIFPVIGANQRLPYGMIDNAVRKACATENADLLMNVRVYNSSWYIPYIFGLETIKIKGDALKKVK